MLRPVGGVSIYQSTAAIDKYNNIFFSDVKRLNEIEGKNYLLEDVIEALDFDDFDTFEPQNPKNFTEGIEKTITSPSGVLGAASTDPDSAEIDDK